MASISDLRSDHKNARKRTDRSATLIEESLKRYGAARSVVIDEDNRILAGNGTVDAAKRAGISKVRVIETEGDEIIAVKRTGLTEDQKIGLALADNRTSDLSEWDKEMLHQLSEEHDITPWFEAEDLAEIMGEVEVIPAEGLTDADDVPEPPTDPITKPGDLWVLGNHRLLCGDSTDALAVERLMDGKKADMVFTDPPYNIASENKGVAAEVSKAHRDLMNAEWDKGFDFAEVQGCLLAAIAENATVYVCTSHHLAGSIWQWMKTWSSHSNWCVWSKPNPMPSLMKRHWTWSGELICYGTRGKHVFNFPDEGHALSIWTITKVNGSSGHPTEKPVSVPEHAVLHSSKKGQLVLDLFGGSGSTLIACEKTGRQARLMELDPAYCDVIVKRWEDFTGKKAILEESQEAY
jgi:DNA modification methylase